LARREANAIQSLVSSPDCGANKSVNPTPIPNPMSKLNTIFPFGMTVYPQLAVIDPFALVHLLGAFETGLVVEKTLSQRHGRFASAVARPH
jgi:hypothetical protein